MNAASKTSLDHTIQVFALHLEHLVSQAQAFHSQICNFCKDSLALTQLTPLQYTLFKVLLILLLGTAILIWYSWRVYGKVITDKFVRPSTLKEIEELKLSVAKLKLPDHSPRI